ncbi:alpha/beta hydrolase [Aspergillus brunneoviolaceus CBS 621.78]|uniref:Alpha/beta-hydrolase n=1 Tax=Aspergillus brunneoviolaceus CBS 621.78 TaxID=1450534 RepID=A0ACD1G5X5_9EURO|nr:alpha/beta-hydrolase [Aspergillus brunneoviolaceus CBS 621.78]RAH44572.1 alpha/beta-hydrolase [Aspergillus brunneoviolaceus CBS 621.78]
MNSPVIVFSLGAWITPPFFHALRAQLQDLGFASKCPAHPSIGAEPPSKTLSDDVASLRRLLTNLADAENEIVVVAHSYGGVVASNAVDGLSKTTRAQSGQAGGVVQVIYLAAFALDRGQSLLEMLGGSFLPWMQVEGDYVHIDGSSHIGWQDLPLDEQVQWNTFTHHTSRAVFAGKVMHEPWSSEVPCAYVICEQDQAMPPAFQEGFAAKVAGPENTYRLPASHSPFLSMPIRLADVLVEAIGEGSEEAVLSRL